MFFLQTTKLPEKNLKCFWNWLKLSQSISILGTVETDVLSTKVCCYSYIDFALVVVVHKNVIALFLCDRFQISKHDIYKSCSHNSFTLV